MKHITLAVCLMLSMTCMSQQNISLPKDNGKTTSFCESMDMGSKAKVTYDSACSRMKEYVVIREVIINGNEATAFMHFNEMQQGVYGKVVVSRHGKHVNYCIEDFRVNSIPLDDWLTTANATIAEQVKGRIFSTTVLLIASIKNNSVLLTQR